jgi:histidine ammonia-lyase
VLSAVVARVRRVVPPLAEDRPLGRDIEEMSSAIREGIFDEWAEIPVNRPETQGALK